MQFIIYKMYNGDHDVLTHCLMVVSTANNVMSLTLLIFTEGG